MKKGIDISYHQGTIDFDLVKKDGIEFVIPRVGYRDKVDIRFFEYVEKSKKAGISIIGVYFFSYALNVDQVKDEAKLCIEAMKKAGLDKNVLVFYDFEYDTVKKAKEKNVILTSKNCNDHTKTFCEEIKKCGYNPGIYTNLDYYKNWYDRDILEKYPIWLADYKGEPDYKCLIQQHTDVGKVKGIKVNVDMNYYYEEEFKMKEENKRSRNEVVKLARSWVGKKESDGSFKFIIDTYNSYTPHPRGVKMTYTASWCATFWSALAISLGYTDIIPIECSCGELIKKAKEMGIWIEDDAYEACFGDAILYDWDDNGVGDNVGWPDHIGVIEKISNGVNSGKTYTVIEGNKNNAVGRRTIKVDGKYIRGFITPRYDDTDTKTDIETEVTEKTKWVVTAHSLNVREKATKDSKSIGIVKKGTELTEWNSTVENGKRWIETTILGTNKIGWCSEGSNGEVYLKRI